MIIYKYYFGIWLVYKYIYKMFVYGIIEVYKILYVNCIFILVNKLINDNKCNLVLDVGLYC